MTTLKALHGKLYAGNPHVRFDEGYPPKNGEARFEGSRRPSGRTLRGRPALLYTLLSNDRKTRSHDLGFLQIAVVPKKVVHTSSPLAVDLGYNLRCLGGIQL